jgi:sugar phosphate isomerase/epimerase
MEYHFGGADDSDRFLLAKRLGLEGVEVMVTHQQLMDPEQKRLRDLVRARDVSGIEIPSLLLADHDVERGISRPEPVLAAEAAKDIRRVVDWAVELGAGVILVPFFEAAEIVTEADFQRAVCGFRELCPPTFAKGVHLCCECTLAADELLRLAEEIGSEGFGCYFDTANVVFLGMDTATEIRKLGSLIKQVHVKDCRIFPGDCRLGQGLVDLTESAAALREIGYDGWLVGEFTEYPDDPGTPIPPPEIVAHDISFTQFLFPELKRMETWPRLGAAACDFKRGELSQLIGNFNGYGLSAVQWCGELLEEALEHPSGIPGIRDELEANGIIVAGLSGAGNLVSPDPDEREATITFLKRCLEAAPLFGSSVVTAQTGTRHPEGGKLPSLENQSGEVWELLCTALEELLTVAERHGSILAIEGHINHVLRTEGQIIGLVDRFPTKHLRLVLDPYSYLSKHLLPAGDRTVAGYLDRWGHLFVLAYLRDVGPEGAETNLLEFGQGVFPQALYLDFLRTRRPDLPIILEDLPFDHIPVAIQRIQSFK